MQVNSVVHGAASIWVLALANGFLYVYFFPNVYGHFTDRDQICQAPKCIICECYIIVRISFFAMLHVMVLEISCRHHDRKRLKENGFQRVEHEAARLE